MPTPDFTIRANDTASIITSTLEDSTGAAVDLQNATVRFHMHLLSGAATPVLNAAATNAQNGNGGDGTKGHVSYAWVAGNTAVSGFYLGEWEVTFSGGSVQTFPNAGYVVIYVSREVA